MNTIAKKYYGFELKDHQREIIQNIINNHDTIGILSTGYGKSICYQIPFLLSNKSVIVISPLISLMEDQYKKLKNKNIVAYCMSSTNKKKNQDKIDILEREKNGIIYMSPEYFQLNKDFIKKLNENNQLCLIAIDECHCISTWCDFRPEYKELYQIKNWTHNVPILALTATATNTIIENINNTLNLKNVKIVKSSCYRNNLNINILKKNTVKKDIDTLKKIINKIDKKDKIIIYCKTISDTEDLKNELQKCEYKCDNYHSKKNLEIRKQIQDDFSLNNINIIIATCSFGMGIDEPNIRLIINYGLSRDIESFYQEIGRAGRDGNESKIYMFWNNKDIVINKSFDKNKNINIINKYEIQRFVTSNQCRMQFICDYFNEKINVCNNCDVCDKKINIKSTDISTETKNIYELVKYLKTNYGITLLCEILYGSKTKKMNNFFKNLKWYGSLKHFTKSKIKEVINQLICDKYLLEKTIKLSYNNINVICINKEKSITRFLFHE